MEEKDQLILSEMEFEKLFDKLDHEDICNQEPIFRKPKIDKGASIDRSAVESATAEFLKRGGKITSG